MVKQHSKWERDMDNKSDKQQIKFGANSEIIQPKPAEITQFTSVNCNELVMCPFCLYQAKLSAFFISTKKGISQGKAQCPECKNGMLMKSLWNDMSASEYAQWVYNYSASGYWKKCPFQLWKARLKAIGWSQAFWGRYKELKGVDAAESVFSDAERMARDYGIDTEKDK